MFIMASVSSRWWSMAEALQSFLSPRFTTVAAEGSQPVSDGPELGSGGSDSAC